MEILGRRGEVDDVVLEVLGAVYVRIVSFQNVSSEDGRTSQFLDIVLSSNNANTFTSEP